MNARGKVFKLISVILILSISGCSLLGGKSPRVKSLKLSDYNPEINNQHTKLIIVDRDKMKKSLASTAASTRVRLIKLLYRQGEMKPYPEYRIFGIDDGSPYSLLGLEDADVIVSANGYILPSPQRFTKFIQLLGEVDKATIRFRRGDKALAYEYLFK